VVKLYIQHTGPLAGQNANSDQGILRESGLTMALEVMPPKTDDEKLQLQVMTFPEQVISSLRMTFLNKFRLSGGKAKVLIIFNTLKEKWLGWVTHGRIFIFNNCESKITLFGYC